MASGGNSRSIVYKVGFDVDVASLRSSVEQATKSLESIQTTGANSRKLPFNRELQEANQSAQELKRHLQEAFNTETGHLDLGVLQQQMEQSGMSLEKYALQLQKLGPEGEKAFMHVASAITQADMPLRRTTVLLDKMWTTLSNTLRWQISSRVLYGFFGAISTAYGYTQDLNESLNSIRMITQQSTEEMGRFAEKANEAAKALSTTTVEYSNAALIYYRQGLTGEDVLDRADVTTKLANVSGETAEQASEQMTAVWNNFYDGSKSLEYYADVMAKLGATTASSVTEISTGLQKFAAIAGTVGLSYEYAASALATITATTRQSAEVVGTSLRTLFGRIESLKLGETLEDGVDLNKYSEALKTAGVEILDMNGNLKDMDVILDETMEKWQTLTRAQQMALAQTVAGVRQYTQFVALMDQSDFFKQNLQTAYGAEGTLGQQQAIYAESWEAARDRVKAAAEDISDSLINEDFFIGLDKAATPLLTVIAKMIDGFGGMGGAVSILSGLMLRAFSGKIVTGLMTMREVMFSFTGKTAEAAAEMKTLAMELTKATNLSATTETVEGREVFMMQQKLQLQELINSSINEIPTSQQKVLQNDVNRIKNLQTQLELQSQITEKTGSLAEEARGSLLSTDLSEGWQGRVTGTKGAKITRGMRSFDLIRDSKGHFKNLGTADEFKQALIDQTEILSRQKAALQEINATYNAGAVNKDRVIELANAHNLLHNGQKVSKDNVDKFIESLDKQTAAINSDLDGMRAIAKEAGLNSTAFENFITNIQGNEKALQSFKEITGLSSEEMFKMAIKTGRVAKEDLPELGKQLGVADDKINEIIESTEQGSYSMKNWADKAVAAAQALAGLSMAYSGIKSMTESFYDLLEGEKDFGEFFENLGGSIFSLMFAFSLIPKAMLPVVGVIAAITILTQTIEYFKGAQDRAKAAIEEATSAYQEQKDELKSLQDELDSTQEKIKELESNGISLVNQDEYNRLKQTEASLERQLKIQERQAELERKRALATASANMGSAFKGLGDQELDQATKDSLVEQNIRAISTYANEDQNFASQVRQGFLDRLEMGLDRDSTLALLEHYYNDRLEDPSINAENNLEILKDYFEQAKAYANDYFDSLYDLNVAEVDSQIATYSTLLEEYENLSEREQKIVDRIIEKSTEALQRLYNLNPSAFIQDYIAPIANSFDFSDYFSTGEISKEVEQALRLSGIGTDFFKEILSDVQNSLSTAIGSVNADYFLRGLSQEDLSLLFSINLDNIQNWDNFLEEFYELKAGKNTIVVDLQVAQNSAYDVLEKIRQGEFLDEEDIKALKESFQGIFDLGNIEELPLNDQLSVIKMALETTFNSDLWESQIDSLNNYLTNLDSQLDTLNDFKSSFETLKKEADRLYETGIFDTWEEAYETARKNIEASVKAEIKTTKAQIESLRDQIDQIFSDPFVLNIEIDKKITNEIAAEMGIIRKAVSLISEDFQVEADNVAELAKVMPEIFKGASAGMNEAGDQVIQLSRETINEIGAIYQEQTEAQRQNQLDRLFGELDTASKVLSITQALADDIKTEDGNVTANYRTELGKREGVSASTVKEIVRLRLIQKIRENAAAEETTDKQTAELQTTINAENAGNTLRVQNSAKASQLMATDYHNALVQMQRERAMFEQGQNIGSTWSRQVSGWNYSPGFNSTLSYKKVEASKSKDTSREEAAVNAMFSANGDLAKAAALLGMDPETAADTIAKALTTAGFYSVDDEPSITQENLTRVLENVLNDKSIFEGMTAEERAGLGGLAEEDVGELASLIAKLLDDGSFAQFLNGKTGKSKSSSSASALQEEGKELKEVEERYHEINRAIEIQDSLLSELKTQIDRTFGTKRLELYDKQMINLQDQLDNYNKKLLENTKYLAEDTAKVKGLISGVVIDKDEASKTYGEILNYTDLLEQIYKERNKAAIAYNNWLKANEGNTEYDKNRKKELELALKEADDLLEKQEKALKQYEETLNTRRELQEKEADIARQISDSKLDELNFKFELIFSTKDVFDKARELSKTLTESFGDALTQTLTTSLHRGVAELTRETLNEEMDLLATYQGRYTELQEQMVNATDAVDTQRISEELSDLVDKISSSVSAIVEWTDYWENMVPNAINAASERLKKFTDQLSKNTSVLDTVKELMILQGQLNKTEEGFIRLQRISQERLEAQRQSAMVSYNWYQTMKDGLEDAKRAFEEFNGDEQSSEYDYLRNNYEAYLAQFNEAQQAYLDSAKAAMETAKQMYLDQISHAAYEFGEALKTDLDYLSTRYDHYIDQEERYLDAVNTAYQTTTWYNKLQADIDKALTSSQKERYKALQDEVGVRAENNKLNQYDLDIIEAKYKVLQAQAALEDAQAAKNNLRLVRDRQGNWNYQFTANPDEVAKAQQDLDDARNDWYNIAKKQTKDVTGQIIATWEECQQAIEELYQNMELTDEERSARAIEIYDYYRQAITDLEREKQIAIADMTEAGELTIQNFENTYAEALSGMSTSQEDFERALKDYMAECEDHYRDFKDTVHEVGIDTGTDLVELDKKVDEVAVSTRDVGNAAVEAESKISGTLHTIQTLADYYKEVAREADEAAEAMRRVAMEAARTVGANSRLEGDKEIDYSMEMLRMAQKGDSANWNQIAYWGEMRQNKINQEGMEGLVDSDTIVALLKQAYTGKGDPELQALLARILAGELFFTTGSGGKYFATGGYTGEWGNSSKLAWLDQKELVLNANDTSNILAAVEVIRAIAHDLDANAAMTSGFLAQRLGGVIPAAANPGALEQDVHIEAVFPNVTESHEIEQALASLVNDAAQWANREKS